MAENVSCLDEPVKWTDGKGKTKMVNAEQIEAKCHVCGAPLYYEGVFCDGTDLYVWAKCHECQRRFRIRFGWD